MEKMEKPKRIYERGVNNFPKYGSKREEKRKRRAQNQRTDLGLKSGALPRIFSNLSHISSLLQLELLPSLLTPDIQQWFLQQSGSPPQQQIVP
jgi:hypothetical protein